MALYAKFDSVTLCPGGCGMRIRAGEPIRYNPAVSAFVHDSCAPQAERPQVVSKCLVCGREKPCRCDD